MRCSRVPATALAAILALITAFGAPESRATELSGVPASVEIPPVEMPYVDEFTGVLGLYVARVDPAAGRYRELAVLRHGEERAFPLASTFKLFVLLEVMRAIDRGELSWSQRVEIAAHDHSLDPGRIPARLPVGRLVRRMIGDSHNTSTDVLFKRVGIEAPATALAGIGLSSIRVTLPTREFWVALGGLAPALFPYDELRSAAREYAALDRDGQLRRVAALVEAGRGFDADRIDRATGDFYDFRGWTRDEAFAILDDLDNAARPDDLVRFLYYLFLDNGLSPATDARMRRVLARGDRAVDRRHIRVPLTYWGGKGGSDLGMGSMAGYAVTRSGHHVLYAIMGAAMERENADWTILERLLTWAVDEVVAD